MNRLPVLRPTLPSAARLLPYLEAIDACRIYTNHGPLLAQFQARLASRLHLSASSVVCTSSGTSAIVGAVLGVAGRAKEMRPLAIVPAFTFVATATAVEQCGYEPYLADIDAANWMLDPETLARHPMLHRVGVVVPVAPFGTPVPQAPWRRFSRLTGIPVVIDGAASFDTVVRYPDAYVGDIPLTFSFHATKAFGVGEGGAIVVRDDDVAMRVSRTLNFGFHGSRNSRSPSTNGKMSEYAAAVGLAELDGWEAKYAALSSVMAHYRHSMEAVQLPGLLRTSPDISASYALLIGRTHEETENVERNLDRHGIDCRRWYGAGVQDHSYFSALARDRLEATDDALSRVLGLPVAADLTESEIGGVVAAIREAIRD